jgi:hypothetical protein
MSPGEIAPTGHSSMQEPQATQSVLILCAILFVELKRFGCFFPAAKVRKELVMCKFFFGYRRKSWWM